MFRLLVILIVLSHENLQMQEYIDDRSRGSHGLSLRSTLTTRRASGICYSSKPLSIFCKGWRRLVLLSLAAFENSVEDGTPWLYHLQACTGEHVCRLVTFLQLVFKIRE